MVAASLLSVSLSLSLSLVLLLVLLALLLLVLLVLLLLVLLLLVLPLLLLLLLVLLPSLSLFLSQGGGFFAFSAASPLRRLPAVQLDEPRPGRARVGAPQEVEGHRRTRPYDTGMPVRTSAGVTGTWHPPRSPPC